MKRQQRLKPIVKRYSWKRGSLTGVRELTTDLGSKAQELAKIEVNLKSMSKAKAQLQKEYEDS